MNNARVLALLFALGLATASLPTLAGPTFTLGTQESSRYITAEIVSSPRPEIPAELHEQCFKSCCIARFLIQSNGKTSVKLVSSTGNLEVDDIAIKTLQQWRFKPAQVDGSPVESTRKIRVEFEIE